MKIDQVAGRFAFLHFFIDGTTQRKSLKIQRKFYAKIKKRKMHFWTPTRFFLCVVLSIKKCKNENLQAT